MRRLALLALALSACRAAPEAPTAPAPGRPQGAEAVDSSAARGADPAAAPFAGTVEATERPAQGGPAVRLETVRTGTHPGFDRITLTFAGERLPGYRIVYTDAVQTCGEGRSVELGTPALLRVTLQPAAAHTEAGAPTVAPRDAAFGLPVLARGLLTCDFEAEVTWALGLAARVPYRVLELRHPTRLAIDVQHAR